MLDIGWQELLVIGALALIVVGPKDLPSLLRSVGQWVGKIRGMARDFQRTMNDAARETEVSAFKDLQDLKKIDPLKDFKAQASNAQSFLNGSGDAPESKTAAAKAETPKASAAEDEDPGMVDATGSEPARPAPAPDAAPANPTLANQTPANPATANPTVGNPTIADAAAASETAPKAANT